MDMNRKSYESLTRRTRALLTSTTLVTFVWMERVTILRKIERRETETNVGRWSCFVCVLEYGFVCFVLMDVIVREVCGGFGR